MIIINLSGIILSKLIESLSCCFLKRTPSTLLIWWFMYRIPMILNSLITGKLDNREQEIWLGQSFLTFNSMFHKRPNFKIHVLHLVTPMIPLTRGYGWGQKMWFFEEKNVPLNHKNCENRDFRQNHVFCKYALKKHCIIYILSFKDYYVNTNYNFDFFGYKIIICLHICFLRKCNDSGMGLALSKGSEPP